MLSLSQAIIKNPMSILHIAEKNSIAKQVANVLSNSTKRTAFSNSKFNPVYEFELDADRHSFSSVRGHIFGHDLPPEWKNWKGNDNKKILLSQVPMVKKLGPDMEDVVANLTRLARNHKQLILWLDCDREGEAIAFEVIDICTEVNPRIKIKRARFAAVTHVDVWNAYNGLVAPNKLEADAVNYRIEIDFRSGYAFTRYQTLAFQSYFNMEKGGVLSYGPCQLPTLSFVVQRYLEIKNFKPEKFWFIEVICVIDDNTGIPFTWNKKNTRNELQANQTLFRILSRFPDGDVTGVVKQKNKNEKKKYRPYPLTTVKFQKLATDKLRMSSAKAMEIAQKLYQRGLISYPRTETNAFPKTMNLKSLLERFNNSSTYGSYVNKLLGPDNKYVHPKMGSSNDEAHTPIHPVKKADKQSMTPQQWKVYDLIVRSFLACCSGDAVGEEFEVKAEVGGEGFKASYLTIKQLNYLQIYPFQKWTQTSFPASIPDRFPAMVTLKDSKTTPPGYLTEADLIDLMEKNQIGTDATIHEHIETIQKRQYAVKNNNTFKPTNLGASLVQAYNQLGIDLPKCQVRRRIEEKMNKIAEGAVLKDIATKQTLEEMVPIYQKLQGMRQRWLELLKKYMQENSDLKQIEVQQRNQDSQRKAARQSLIACKCQKCGEPALAKYTQKRQAYFIGCSAYPTCNWLQPLPSYIMEIKQTDKVCQKCQFGKIVEITAKEGKVVEPFMMRMRFSEANEGRVEVCLSPQCDKDLYDNIEQHMGYSTNASQPAQRGNYNSDSTSNFTSFNNRFWEQKKKARRADSSAEASNGYRSNQRTNVRSNNQNSDNTRSNWQSREKKEIICYRCRQPGHIAPQCPNKDGNASNFAVNRKVSEFRGHTQNKYKKNGEDTMNFEATNVTKKVCGECGVEGRHPRGSNCPTVVRNRKQKQ